MQVMDKRKWSDNDRNMSHFFMKAYTNFAIHGQVINTFNFLI